MHHPSKDIHVDSSLDHQEPSENFKIMLLEMTIYTWRNSQYSIILNLHLQATHQHEHHRLLAHAREYSVWNATVAALQFWTADLEAHVLSSTTEQVYNAFFYSTSMHLLHQQSGEILFGHFMTTLNAAFESKLALEDEGYESGSENFNIPIHLEEPPRFIMFSVSRVHLLIQIQLLHAAQVPESHIADLYVDAWPSALLKKMMTPLQMRFYPLTVHHQCGTT